MAELIILFSQHYKGSQTNMFDFKIMTATNVMGTSSQKNQKLLLADKLWSNVLYSLVKSRNINYIDQTML